MVLILFLGGLYLVIKAISLRKKTPKIFALSFLLFGISSILFGFIKLGQISSFYQSYTNLLREIIITIFILAFPLLFIGGYQKVKMEGRMNIQAKKDFIIMGSFLLSALFILFLWLRTK